MTVRYEEVAHARYLTFGCYRRKHLFQYVHLADMFVEHLDAWREKHDLELWAFVVMPNHVHLLVYPKEINLGKSCSIEANQRFQRTAMVEATQAGYLRGVGRQRPWNFDSPSLARRGRL